MRVNKRGAVRVLVFWAWVVAIGSGIWYDAPLVVAVTLATPIVGLMTAILYVD